MNETRFYTLDRANNVVYELGSTEAPFTWTYSPAFEQRYYFRPGQSYTYNSTVQCTSTSQTERCEADEKITGTVKFIGYEKVTVPAGSFDACKLEIIEVEGSQTDTFTRWLRQGDGVQLRMDVNGKKSEELISFTAN